MHTMTPRQRELATTAHNIIYAYLRDRNLPIEDYYDVVAFGFMEAVQQYDENKELAKKYKLSTIAYRKMDDKLSALRIYENRKKRKADVRSLEATLAGTENMCIADTVSNTEEGPAQEAEANVIYLKIEERATPAQRAAAQARAAGYTAQEAAELLGTTTSAIYNRINRFKAHAAAVMAL